MIYVIMQDSGSPIRETSISAFEERLRIKLPDDYKSFLLKSNGGRPEKTWVFDFYDIHYERADSSVINDLYVLRDEDTTKRDDIIFVYKTLLEGGQIPQGLLPIADDPGGNIIFICVSDSDYSCDFGNSHSYGKVFFGDHERQDPETGYIALSPVASSFAEFLGKLYAHKPNLLCEGLF